MILTINVTTKQPHKIIEIEKKYYQSTPRQQIKAWSDLISAINIWSKTIFHSPDNREIKFQDRATTISKCDKYNY